jgi:hypothetical protein
VLKFRFLVVFLVAASFSHLIAQNRVDARYMYERLICIVPVVGTGNPGDPRRPLYAPLPPRTGSPALADGIIAYNSVLSDDGRFALIELVARDRSAFDDILKENRADVRIFERGKSARAQIEQEFRKHKRNFDLDHFEVIVP